MACDHSVALCLIRRATAYGRFAEGCLADIQAKPPASNVVMLRPRGIGSGESFGRPTITGGSLPDDPSQFESELALLKEANRAANSHPTPWRVKS
jgi:hypothetical protein